MEFTPIVSEKDIKTLLLEEAKALENGQRPRLIILSSKRFQEFVKRKDVLHEDWCNANDDLDYSVHENEQILICKHYGFVRFKHISGFYIVKRLFDSDEYYCWHEEPSEIAYIE